jgi:acetyl-CoA acetyltransferase
VTVNRFCASSLTGTILTAHAIRSGEVSLGVAAGVESMSRSASAWNEGRCSVLTSRTSVRLGHDVVGPRRPAEPGSASPTTRAVRVHDGVLRAAEHLRSPLNQCLALAGPVAARRNTYSKFEGCGPRLHRGE